MKIFTKSIAFILLLIWCMFTMLIIFSIVGAMVICSADWHRDWFCGGRRLLEHILQ